MCASNSIRKKATGIDHEISLGAKVDGAEHLLEQVAETEHGDELDYRLNRGHDSRGSHYRRQNDYDWTRSTAVGPDRRFGETLEQQEKRLGREAEQERHRNTARDAHEAEIDRAAASRAITRTEQQQASRDFWERKHLADGRTTVTIDEGTGPRTRDPRADLDRDQLAEINQQAYHLADRFDVTPSAIARRLAAEYDKETTSLADATLRVVEALDGDLGVPTLADDVDPDASAVTVEGEVTTLFDPASPNQYQVGYLEDNAGDAIKVTVWVRSTHGPMVQTLREGDRVRIVDGKPGEYDGTTTVAATSETCIVVLDRGDGPAPTGECRASTNSDGSQPRMASWRVDTPSHQWMNDSERKRFVTTPEGLVPADEADPNAKETVTTFVTKQAGSTDRLSTTKEVELSL